MSSRAPALTRQIVDIVLAACTQVICAGEQAPRSVLKKLFISPNGPWFLRPFPSDRHHHRPPRPGAHRQVGYLL
jgi:hypothetical protein